MSDVDPETGEIVDSPPIAAPSPPPQMRPSASIDTNEIIPALCKAQGVFEAPKRTKKAKVTGENRKGERYEYEYTYAPLEEIVSVVQKPLADVGIYRQQYLVSRSNMWLVRTILWHTSGQWMSGDYPVLAEAMTGPKFAAAVTYAKRQGLSLVTGVAPEDDMDAIDGDVDHVDYQPARKQLARPPNKERQRVWSNDTANTEPVATPGGPAESVDGTKRVPKWIGEFLKRDTYYINPKEAGGWSPWEKFWLQIAENATNIHQVIKLEEDNKPEIVEYRKAVNPAVWEAFADRVKRRKLTIDGIVP